MTTEIKNFKELKDFLNIMPDNDLQQSILLEYGEMQPNVKIRKIVVTDENWYAHIDDYDDCGNLSELQLQHGESLMIEDYRVIMRKGMVYFTD